jgi:hypothetical protein
VPTPSLVFTKARLPLHVRRVVVGGLVSVLASCLMVVPAQAAAPSPIERSKARAITGVAQAATLASPARAQKPAVPRRVALGAYTDDLASFEQLRRQTGASLRTFTYYRSWADSASFDADFAARVAATGATPSITWEPWSPQAGVEQPTYRLRRIADGAFDSYVDRWAAGIRAYGKPVVLRFGHEMNGNWYPWAESVNGNRPGDYVAAWKRVQDRFTAARVTNVTWVWSPNISYPGSTPLRGLYPGDARVQLVGLDGYNGGTALPWGGWRSFSALFDPSLAEVARFTARPVVIGETSSAEAGGSKAAWTRDLFRAVAARPRIVGVTFFNTDKETDWRVQSSASALQAFTAGVAAPLYRPAR